MKSRLLYFALYALVACGPAPGSDTDTDTGSDSGSTGGPGSGSSSTGPTAPDVPESELCSCNGSPGCGVVTSCENFVVACEWEPCDPEMWWAVDDEPALECAIQALRDRRPGSVTWTVIFGFDAGTAEEVILDIRDDGTAVYRPTYPRRCRRGPGTHLTLEDVSYFEGCLAEPDALARFTCLNEGFVEALAVCGEEVAIECEPDPEVFPE